MSFLLSLLLSARVEMICALVSCLPAMVFLLRVFSIGKRVCWFPLTPAIAHGHHHGRPRHRRTSLPAEREVASCGHLITPCLAFCQALFLIADQFSAMPVERKVRSSRETPAKIGVLCQSDRY